MTLLDDATDASAGSRLRRAFAFALPVGICVALLAAAGEIPPWAALVSALVALASGLVTPQGGRVGVAVRPASDGAPVRPALQDLLERFPDPVILLNQAREIVAGNAAARDVLGIGQFGRDLALSLRHPGVLAAVQAILEGVPSVSEEITLPQPVPRTFMLHAGSLPPDADAHAARIVLVLRDETRARRAEQSRADFVANASHELRSPLSALLGFIETMRGPAADDATARERFLSIMLGEAKRMARLVDDLMSLSRVEINEHVPPRQRVDICELLASVAEALHARAEHRRMRIHLDCPAELPQVQGDADQLTQVFHNLIDNAIKYSRAGTRIRIRVQAVDRLPGTQVQGVSIAVRDEGEGIAAIHLPRLTERFYRADEGRSRRLGGTGLGLAIVKHIVNRHRGRLVVQSEVGVGSTFTIFLPAAAGAAPATLPGSALATLATGAPASGASTPAASAPAAAAPAAHPSPPGGAGDGHSDPALPP